MTIEAYLDPAENETVVELTELSPEAYKGIANGLSINNAEQAIIDEVSGVDGDEDGVEEEELAQERETKTLFESLYEIDPDTKEVFVKGSAYDLKKWEDDMVCFVFGDPERVVAMEDSISPAEHRLTQAWNRLEGKRTTLSRIVRKHSDQLHAQTVSKAFAADYQAVMGHPLGGIRMESFTTEPSSTNYKIAMEEMTGAQMAMAAGAGLVGVGIIYKMIQWFARTLNRNGDANNSIGQNVKGYFERKERIKNAAYRLSISKEEIKKTLDALQADLDKDKITDADKGLSKLKQALEGDDNEAIFNALSKVYLKGSLKGQLTPFMQLLIEGKISQNWWATLTGLSEAATQAQIKLGGYITEIASAEKLPVDKPDPVDFGFLDKLSPILAELNIKEGFTPFVPAEKNAQACMESFVSAYTISFTPVNATFDFDKADQGLENSFAHLDLSAFNKFTPEYINNLIAVGKSIEEEVKKSHGEAEKQVKDKTNKQDVDAKRERLNLLTREFKAISNLLRFIIAVRNQLGKLSVALGHASERSENWIVQAARNAGEITSKASQVVKDTANAFSK